MQKYLQLLDKGKATMPKYSLTLEPLTALLRDGEDALNGGISHLTETLCLMRIGEEVSPEPRSLMIEPRLY